jgi:hypothetical protein
MRFHWQGLVMPLDNRLPSHCDRVVVVAPLFDQIGPRCSHAPRVRIVSTSECLDELHDTTFDRGTCQGSGHPCSSVDEHEH